MIPATGEPLSGQAKNQNSRPPGLSPSSPARCKAARLTPPAPAARPDPWYCLDPRLRFTWGSTFFRPDWFQISLA